MAPVTFINRAEGSSPAGGIAVAGDGTLLISDEFNHRIEVHSPAGEVSYFGEQGSNAGHFHYPKGIAVADDGKIYIADSWNHRVQIFDENYNHIKSMGNIGNAKGQLDEPVAVIIDNQQLYVLEKSNHRVQLFSLKGEPLGSFGTRGSSAEIKEQFINPSHPNLFSLPCLEYPAAITTDGTGNFYIADTNNNSIIAANRSGDASQTFVSGKIPFPSGVACDEAKNIHATQFNSTYITVFSPAGQKLYQYSAGLQMPQSITIRGKHIYIGCGLKPNIAKLEIKSKHDYAYSIEGRFSSLLKELSLNLDMQRVDEVTACLKLLAELPPPSADDLSMLPEVAGGSIMPVGIGGEHLTLLIERLQAAAAKLEDELIAELDKKVLAIENLAEAITKADAKHRLSTELDEALLLAKYEETTKVTNIGKGITLLFASIKKIECFSARFANGMADKSKRLKRLGEAANFILNIQSRRAGWHSTLEELAPNITAETAVEQRAGFTSAEQKRLFTNQEHSQIVRYSHDINIELSNIATAELGKAEPLMIENITNSLELYSVLAESFATTSLLYISIDELMHAAKPARLTAIIEKQSNENINQLYKEDRIPIGPTSAVSLLSANWLPEPPAAATMPDDAVWKRITTFYLAELERYLAEHKPLINELSATQHKIPATMKSDMRLAEQMERKIELLQFHCSYQEKYICGILQEFCLRFSMLPNINSSNEELLAATEKQLSEMLCISPKNYRDNEWKMTQYSNEQAEGNKSRETEKIEKNFTIHEWGFLSIATTVGALIKRRVTKNRPEVAGVFCGTPLEPWRLKTPIFISKGMGDSLLTASAISCKAYLLEKNSITMFAGFGSMPSKLPHITGGFISANGKLHLFTVKEHKVTRYNKDGSLDKVIQLKNIDAGWQPLRMQEHEGKIYCTFVNQNKIAVFNNDGELIKTINMAGAELENLGIINALAIHDSKIILAGNSLLAITDMDGNLLKSCRSTNLAFGKVIDISVSDGGSIYALEIDSNRLIKTDTNLSHFCEIKGTGTALCFGVAAIGGKVYLADYLSNKISVIKEFTKS